MEVVNETGITARETGAAETMPWNLASAGRYQDGEGLVRVKRLKKVVVVFGSVQGTFQPCFLGVCPLVDHLCTARLEVGFGWLTDLGVDREGGVCELLYGSAEAIPWGLERGDWVTAIEKRWLCRPDRVCLTLFSMPMETVLI